MYIPKYFSLNEFLRSYTATKYGIDNVPTFRHLENILRMCELVLDNTRMQLDKPILITSGYRCIELNRKVGGSASSQHLNGCAVDLQCYDLDKLFDILKTNPNIDQLLYEQKCGTKWIHVSIPLKGNKPRRYINEKYIV